MKAASLFRSLKLYHVIALATLGVGSYALIRYLGVRNHTGITIPQLAASSRAGFIPAEFAVGSFGSPSYSIPIEVPPGTNGVQPQLTLEYASVKSNGILGVGWTLRGLSTITRVGSILPQDGIKGGVSLTSGDRFAINGQRLVAYKDSSGNVLLTTAQRNAAYGQNGTEYRTEVESWMRIFSYGNCGGGPCSFIAYSKDGTVTEFAGTADSRIQPAGAAAVLSWAVNKVTDRNGNYVRIQYDQQASAGTYVPLQIDYTGNSKSGQAPQRALVFGYQNRTDSITNFIAGVSTNCFALVNTIQTYLDLDGDGQNVVSKTNLVKTYTIAYNTSNTTGRSIMDSISISDASGNPLPATHFNWSNASLQQYFADTLSLLPSGFSKVLSDDVQKVKADFNGDGRLDIALLQNNASTVPVVFSNSNGNFAVTQQPSPSGFSGYFNNSGVSVQTGDFNGDGLTDIAFFQNNSNTVPVMFSTGYGRFSGATYTLTSSFNTLLNGISVTKYTGDFNGDGITDIAGFKQGYSKYVPMLISTPGGGFTCILGQIPSQVASLVNAASTSQTLADVNGDGLTDIVCFNTAAQYKSVPILFSNGTGGFTSSLQPLPSLVQNLFNAAGASNYSADFNGDGLVDFCVFKKGFSSVPIIYAKGDGTFDADLVPLTDQAASAFNNGSTQIITGDLNGDGVSDMAGFKQGFTSVPVLFSTAEGNFSYQQISMTDQVAASMNGPGVQHFVSDFNGDGLLDIAGIKQGYQSLPVLYSNNISPVNNCADLLTGITNGIGEITQITYTPFAYQDSSLSDTSLDFPLMGNRFPQFIVSGFTVQDGPSPTSVLSKKYAFRKPIIDNYRGFQGFRQSEEIDIQQQTRTITHYIPEFPYQGITVKTEVFDLARPTQKLGCVTYDYASGQDQTTGVYRVWNNSYWLDHYTQGHYNFTNKKQFTYDADHKLILRITDLGDTVKHHVSYKSFTYTLSNVWWKCFYPTQERAYTDTSAANNWLTWVSSDLYWKKFVYDSCMNQVSQLEYLDNNGGNINNVWVGSNNMFDVYGNVIQQVSAPNYNATDSIRSTITFDALFHTFPAILTSAVPMPGNKQSAALITQLAYEPRFGTKVFVIDANGNKVYNVPDNGMDGFGRIVQTQSTKPFSSDLITSGITSYTQPANTGYMVYATHPVNWNDATQPDSTWPWSLQNYDALNRPIQQQSSAYDNKNTLNTSVAYDRKGYLVKNYLPFFHSAEKGVHYTQNGPTADSLFVKQTYHSHGILNQIWSPPAQNGQDAFITKQYIYDSLDNRIVYVKEPSPVSDSLFVLWKKEFDGGGRLKKKSGPYNVDGTKGNNFSSVQYEYDPLHRLIKTIDPLGETILYTYNSLGQKIWEYRPETDTLFYTFNNNGWLTQKKDDNGKVVWTYDDLGRVLRKQVLSASGAVTGTYGYEYDNNTISTNGLGRLCRLSFPHFQYTYQYDNTGNISQKAVYVEQLNQQFFQSFIYDVTGRLVQSLYPDSALVHYAYNNGNNLTQIELSGDTLAVYGNFTANGTFSSAAYQNGVNTTLAYDQLGRITNNHTSKLAFNITQYRYEWNQANKITTITDDRTHSETDMDQQFTYFASGRLKSADGPYGQLSYTYDAAGNRLTSGNLTYQYDQTKKHELIGVSNNSGSLYALQYDQTGNLQQKVFSAQYITQKAQHYENAADVVVPQAVNYSFDADGKLQSVQATTGTTPFQIDSFVYDDNGDRICKMDSSNTLTFYISPFFEVVKLPSDSMVYTHYAFNGSQVVYSASYNQSTVSIRNQDDPEQLAAGASYGSWTDTFNPQLIWQWSSLLVALLLLLMISIRRTLHCYLHRFHQSFSMMRSKPIIFRRVSYVWMHALMLWVSLVLIHQPVWANMTPGTNGPGVPVAGEIRFYHGDQVGSSVALTDQNGGLTNSITYEPFGSIDQDHSSGPDTFRPKFTGKEYDELIGLDYMGSRYYDSDIGRFVSPDPMEQYYSPYSYGDNDPLSGKDPDGNEFAFIIALVVAAIVGAYVGASIANGSFNPAEWQWDSAKTWVGMVSGAAAGVAVVASGGAALAAFGAVAAESVAIGSIGASTIAFASLDVSFLTMDSYSFAKDPNALNGIFVALDLLPFVGAIIGRASHAVNAGREAATTAEREAGLALKTEGNIAEDVGRSVCPLSFPASTQIVTPNGATAIEQLQVGDQVTGVNLTTGQKDAYAITRLFKRVAIGLVFLITSSSDTIAVTPHHPFYVLGKGWIDAFQVATNDQLYTERSFDQYANASRQQHSAALCQVRSVHVDEDTVVTVYNFEVEQVHNYFLAETGALVHNPKGCGQYNVGGRHGITKQNSERDIVESNHFPASASYSGTPYSYIARDDMPAVTMAYADHRAASSTGSSFYSQQWRLQQQTLLNAGKFADAMAMDIIDMKTITKASGYDVRNGMEAAVDYARNNLGVISKKEHTDLVKLIWK